jgi:hypothetical protein
VSVNKIRIYSRKRCRRPAVGLDAADRFLDNLADPNESLAQEWEFFWQQVGVVRRL